MSKSLRAEEWTKTTINGLEVTHLQSANLSALEEFMQANRSHFLETPKQDGVKAKISKGVTGQFITRVVSATNSKGDNIATLFAHLASLRSAKVKGIENPVAFIKLPENRAAIITHVPKSRSFNEFMDDKKVSFAAKVDFAKEAIRRLARIHAHDLHIGDMRVSNLRVYEKTAKRKVFHLPVLIGFSKLTSAPYAKQHYAEFETLARQLEENLAAQYEHETKQRVESSKGVFENLRKTYNLTMARQNNALSEMYRKAHV